MKNVDIISKVVARRGEAMASPSKGAVPPVDLSGYLLKEIWDRVFEIRTDSNGTEYIFGKFPLVTQYGITMYAGNENLDIPSIYAGIPVDGTTITKREDGTLTINPDIKLGGASNWDDLEGKPSWIGPTKPSYSYSEIEGAPDLGNYALKSDVNLLGEKLNDFLEGSDTDNIINKWKELEVFLNGLSESDNLATILSSKVGKDYVDGNFVTIGGIPQIITGEKNFTGGLKVNGSPIVYDATKKYWKFEGDLLVTGGVTMYGNDSEFIPSTIMDAIQTDGVTIRVNPITKNLEVIGNTSTATTLGQLQNVGNWADSVADVDRIMYQAAGSSQWVAKSLSSIGGGGGVSGDYLPLSGGTVSGDFLVSNSYGGLVLTNTTQEGIGFLLYRGASNWFVTDNGWHSEYRMLHEGNYFYYALPLTGGKLKSSDSPLIIERTDHNSPYVAFMYNNSFVGGIGVLEGDTAFYNPAVSSWQKIWHSGNDGSGSGLDADMLDGKQPSELNVASATKLQTARTIWGQSFDGSGNVNGDMHFNTSNSRLFRNGRELITLHDSYLVLGYDNCSSGMSTYLDGYNIRFRTGRSWSTSMLIDGYGNVGIGTISPSQKLHVQGAGYFNEFVTVNGNINCAALEIIGTVPYIDFHYNRSSADYTARIAEYASGELTLESHLVRTSSNLLVSGGITMYSQRSLKNIIDERGLSLSELSTIKPTRYTWKDGRDNRLHIGGIADDIQQVLPEVVYKTGDNVLTMDYGNAAFAIASSLIKPVIDHEQRIVMLERENKELKKELAYVKRELESN